MTIKIVIWIFVFVLWLVLGFLNVRLIRRHHREMNIEKLDRQDHIVNFTFGFLIYGCAINLLFLKKQENRREEP